MSDTDHTPTTAEVRDLYGYAAGGTRAELAEFDRWLARHDAEVLRKAAREIDWTFETFDADDGIKSIRPHGKHPGDLLNERAARIEGGQP